MFRKKNNFASHILKNIRDVEKMSQLKQLFDIAFLIIDFTFSEKKKCLPLNLDFMDLLFSVFETNR